MSMSHNYQPHNQPGHGYAPPAPRQRSTAGKIALYGCLPITVLGILAFGGCAVIGGAFVNEVDKAVKADANEDARAAKQDVKITSCQITNNELLGKDLKAKVKITNNGGKRANYLIQGELTDQGGNKVGDR